MPFDESPAVSMNSGGAETLRRALRQAMAGNCREELSQSVGPFSPPPHHAGRRPLILTRMCTPGAVRRHGLQPMRLPHRVGGERVGAHDGTVHSLGHPDGVSRSEL
jgi:hypothetical protein